MTGSRPTQIKGGFAVKKFACIYSKCEGRMLKSHSVLLLSVSKKLLSV